jgi:hypothetical protein
MSANKGREEDAQPEPPTMTFAQADISQWTAASGAPAMSWQEQLLTVDEEIKHGCGRHDGLAASMTGTGPFPEALSYAGPTLMHVQT